MRTRTLKSTRWAYLWLALTGILHLFASGKWTLAPAAWLAGVFALLFLYTHPKRIRFLFFYLVFWITLSVSWYGATPIWGAAIPAPSSASTVSCKSFINICSSGVLNFATVWDRSCRIG